jgi:hypothetical protein
MSETNAATVEKLKKLLNLANNNENEHEAQAAMAAAQRLMTAHNLTLAQVESDTGTQANAKREKTENKGKALYEYQRNLMRVVADANFCLHWMDYDLKRKITGGFQKIHKHVLIGREANVIAAQHMFDYLNATMERLVPLDGNTSRLSRTAISWKEGCAARLMQRLATRKAEMVVENKAKEDAARPTQDHNGGGLVIRLENVFEMESDANYEFAYGWAPGTMAKRRQEREMRMEAEAAKPEKPETEAEKKAREKREQKFRDKWEREYQRKWANKDMDAYRAGSEAGKDIGLDAQIAAEARRTGIK